MKGVSGGLSKRAVLRTGYGAVLAVLVFAAAEAYRIQKTTSDQHLEIYRHYVEHDRAVAILRRNLWLASTYVRDFFIRTTPEQAQVLEQQLKELRVEDDAALDKLARMSSRAEVAA